MPKTHHHFYLHRMVRRRNSYIEQCYANGRRPVLPRSTHGWAGVAVILGPRVLGTPHAHIASEAGMGVPIMPGGLGIPVGPKALGIWGPHLVEPLELGRMKLKHDGFNQASVLSFSRDCTVTVAFDTC